MKLIVWIPLNEPCGFEKWFYNYIFHGMKLIITTCLLFTKQRQIEIHIFFIIIILSFLMQKFDCDAIKVKN